MRHHQTTQTDDTQAACTLVGQEDWELYVMGALQETQGISPARNKN